MAGSVAQSAEQEPFKLKVVGSIPTRPTEMFNKSVKITSVSGINFVAKNFLVFLIYDFFEFSEEYYYFLILIYIYIQSYLLHSRFTLKKKIGINSFILFAKLNFILFLVDYVIFTLIKSFFPLVVVSTIFITVFIHTIRIILFSKEMNE